MAHGNNGRISIKECVDACSETQTPTMTMLNHPPRGIPTNNFLLPHLFSRGMHGDWGLWPLGWYAARYLDPSPWQLVHFWHVI